MKQADFSGGQTAPPQNFAAAAAGRNLGFDIAEYWRLALKHRFLILGSFLAALVLGVVATLLMTPVYTATTTLQIDREAARVLNVAEVQPQESLVQGEEFFQTQYGLLRSRSLAERVVDTLGLATSGAFLEKMDVPAARAGEGNAAAQISRRRELVLKTLQRNLSVSPVRGSRLVNVSFQSPDPQLSSQIVDSFAEGFIQANLDRKYESSSYARRFLEERIAQTKTRLEDAERQLAAYAQNQQIINIREGANSDDEPQSLVSADLSSLNEALAVAHTQRVAAEETWRQVSGAPINTIPQVLNNPAIQRLTELRATVDAEYRQKLQIYKPDFPEMVQLKARLDEFDRQISSLASGIRSSVRSDYVIAQSREEALQNRVDSLKVDILDLRNRSIQYNILMREVDTSRTLYDGLLQRYKEVGVTGAITTNNISIIDPSVVPDRPSKPRLLLNLVLAAVLGVGIGVAGAFLVEALDETLASPDDVESKLGLPLLGMTPLLDKGQTPLQALEDVRSSFSEAYYSIRTALQFSTPDGIPKVLAVTSSRPGEGKSTTAYAIALNIARLDQKVLLMDGDLRNPSMHRLIGTNNEAGMSNLLSGGAELGALVKTTGRPNLDFIPCGPLPPNPAELWGGDRLARVLVEALRSYDHVVIDGPPVLGFTDAPLLASAVGGTIFVLEARGTRRAQARGALRRLAMGDARLLGAVLTKFNTRSVQYGGYDYAYDYSYGSGGTQPQNGRRK